MNIIKNDICQIYNLADRLYEVAVDYSIKSISEAYKDKINSFLNVFRKNLYCYIEFPYVDYMYRDSYYLYYSSKHLSYKRDCIRVSFFETEIRSAYFFDKSKTAELQNSFLGYVIVRPISYAPIGRSLFSPRALIENDFIIDKTNVHCSVNGHNLSVSGFPHASQNTETMSCAETSIWIVAEYFSKKYQDYKKILPSDIQYWLSDVSYERSIPTHGLTALQISYLLKKMGFGTRIYSDNNSENFRKIFNYYVESGIPVIAAVQNENISHAVVYIGHENINLDVNIIKTTKEEKFHRFRFIDTAEIPKKYVAMDDNYPPYRPVSFESPTAYYSDEKFKPAKISQFIVPLYPKIYLEASEARRLTLLILSDEKYGYKYSNSSIPWLRFFLTSSKSFKNKLLENSMDLRLRKILLSTAMPKFIWVTEISDENHYLNSKAHGLIILDATSNVHQDFIDTCLFILYKNKYINLQTREVFTINFNAFDIYTSNLKGEK